MTFVSYSQNAEDVLLWRALGHVGQGFYIDVGANDPVEHSVTKAFYERGWSGISIEPLPSFHWEFEQQRPRDINLAIAAGAEDGELVLYDVPEVRGWASPDQSVAEMHRAEGHRIAELTVPVRTLASVCAEHVKGEIHFLKIDVEGFEGEVIRGMDFARWRPWVLVIEATLPNSRVTSHDSWEHMVTGQRYRFAWFDGLNRWYVAEEHAELMEHFGIQPNVFDAFISHHLDKAWGHGKTLSAALQAADEHASELQEAVQRTEQRASALAEALDEAAEQARQEQARATDALQRAAQELQQAAEQQQRTEQERERAEQELAHVRAQLAQMGETMRQQSEWAQGLDERLRAVVASTSWRVTNPLRRAGAIMIALRRPNLARRIVNRVTANERVRRLVIPMLRRYPALNERVSTSIATIKLDPPQQAPAGVEIPEELKGLTLSARTVLADLRRARGNQQADS